MLHDLNIRLIEWLREHEATLSFKLNPPASAELIAHYENSSGCLIPELLKELYSQFNGQAGDCENGIFYEFALYPLELALDAFQVESIPENEEELEEVGDVVDAEGKVKQYWSHKKWIPFAFDYCGNDLSLDFDPGSNGTIGQVIGNGSDVENSVLSSGYRSFIEWHVKKIVSGDYYIGKPTSEEISREYSWTAFRVGKGKMLLPSVRN